MLAVCVCLFLLPCLGSREGTPDEWETVGSTDQHESVFGEMEVVNVPLKEIYICGSQPCVKKGTSSRGGKTQDLKAQVQVSKEV
jgi:hypothetical protein